MKSRFRYGAGCRCGGPETPIVIPPTPCPQCDTDTTPIQLQLTLPGLLDSNCANCETDLAGTFVLEQQWPPDNSITFVSSEGCYYETTFEVDHTNPGETDPDCDVTTWVLGAGNITQFPNLDGAGWFIELVSKRTGMVVQWAQQQPNPLPMDCELERTCPYYSGFGQRECRNVPVGYPSDVPVTLTPVPYVP